MQLHVGDRLQLELLTDSTRSHYYTTLIGFVSGHSVLLRTPQVQSLPIPVREGEPVLVRTFAGRHAYTFESTVDRVCRSPYPYIHLAYPAQVQQTLIRGALRVRVNLTATALNATKQGEALPSALTIADLSISGALLEAEKSLGEVGETLELAQHHPGSDDLEPVGLDVAEAGLAVHLAVAVEIHLHAGLAVVGGAGLAAVADRLAAQVVSALRADVVDVSVAVGAGPAAAVHRRTGAADAAQPRRQRPRHQDGEQDSGKRRQ